MTYHTPVIAGFHPDPSVCRAGNDFFLVASSFILSPDVPIFRSSNLVDWTQIGNVLDRSSQLDLTATRDWSSLGIYAPTIRHHDGQFFMITTNVGSKGAWSFLVTSEDPAGPWSDPLPVPVPGIDPDLAWDDDGNCWVHFSGLGGIARCRIDTSTGAFPSGPDLTWSGTGLQYPEAPHLAPDSIALGFDDDADATHTLARLDGRYLSSEVTGGFLGRLIGMYAVDGEAAFDWFDYREA
jgi:xylan 1,4-beta-xylosidase